MGDTRIRSVVIVGGGTAGWMAAAALARRFGSNGHTRITLVESEAIGTVGVGEATVPAIRRFIAQLGIDETDFIRKTNATFKLAIGFEGWAGKHSFFLHPFTDHGTPLGGVIFPHAWMKMRRAGRAKPIDAYNLGSLLSLAGKFIPPGQLPREGRPSYDYAYHFDAHLVAKYLRGLAERDGVQRIEGKISEVHLHGESGDVEAVELEDGSWIGGDFFIDCSGFRGLLIEGALKTGYEEWTHWLPCDRAVAMPCEARLDPAPYTRALACEAGWQWRIPLQHRVGNGHVYCSGYISDDEAEAQLRRELEGTALRDPLKLRFVTGLRKKIWNRNVYSLGLASGFLEPLESTSIYLMQANLLSLLNNFPSKGMPDRVRDEVNRRSREHWEHIRDFIILHYVLNKREGEPFWDDCRHMSLPSSLEDTIALYRETGRIRKEYTEFFRTPSWVSLFSGFDIVPEYYHPGADDLTEARLEEKMAAIEARYDVIVEKALPHQDFIRKNCSVDMLEN